MPLALWEYLGANLYDRAPPSRPTEYFTEEFEGVTIGFIGAVTEELPTLVSPAGIADIEVGDPTEAVNRVADQLTDGNEANGEADVLVLLVHEGAATTDDRVGDGCDTRFGQIVGRRADEPTSTRSSPVTRHLAYDHVIERSTR